MAESPCNFKNGTLPSSPLDPLTQTSSPLDRLYQTDITVIFEARIKSDLSFPIPVIEIQQEITRSLQDELKDKIHHSFLCTIDSDILDFLSLSKREKIVANLYESPLTNLVPEKFRDGIHYSFNDIFQSIVVTEITASKGNDEKTVNSAPLGEVTRIHIYIYEMHGVPQPLQPSRILEATELDECEDPEIPSAEVFDMPHHEFDGNWEELVFDQDHKEHLFWMISNMLTFSATTIQANRRLSPMVLFHGPPGTGKTTLCQAIAQKIAVRHPGSFTATKLIQVKTATLLSKYYSESAQQVDDLFTKIKILCQNNAKRIILVLIDEVESIAGSRHSGVLHGENQDSLRATNALLTGFDRVRSCPNVVFLSTSNMIDYLDEAFVDRCAIQIPFEAPSETSQYKILKGSIQDLIKREIISVDREAFLDCTQLISSYELAVLYKNVTVGSPSEKLYNIVKLLNTGSAKSKLGHDISGRFLTQIPEQALMKFSRPNKTICLDTALGYIKDCILDSVLVRGQKRKGGEASILPPPYEKRPSSVGPEGTIEGLK